MEVRIDSDDPQNTPGEVLARGMNTMLGYLEHMQRLELQMHEELTRRYGKDLAARLQ